MHEYPQGWEKLVNAALLSLINEACVNVCCATLLSSELVGPACVQARSSNPRGRVCRPNGKGSEEEGILSDGDVVPVYLYCPALSVSVSLGVESWNACRQAAQPLSTPSNRLNLAVRADRAYRQPTNMQPGTFCYR